MAITKLTLKILKKDILENDYTESKECPITRALHRAGRPDLREVVGIFKGGVEMVCISKYKKHSDKLLGMYATKLGKTDYGSIDAIPIKDFQFTIKFEE